MRSQRTRPFWLRRDSVPASFVRIGQRRTRYFAAEAHVVELAADGTEAGFDVAKILAARQLSECHRQILIPPGQIY